MMQAIRTLIVDDEPLARDGLRVRLEREADLELVGEAEDGPGAVAVIRAEHPDLVFLDVQMPGCDGFDVLSQVAGDHLPQVVFVTAFDRYALKAFEVHALDYLLKPITHRRLQDTLRRIRARRSSEPRETGFERVRSLLDARSAQTDPPTQYAARFTVRDGERFILLRVAEIDHADAAANYVRLHVGSRTYHVRMTMSELERRLDPRQFARIHRCNIVNLDRITGIGQDWQGEYQVQLATGAVFRLGRTYRHRLFPG